MVLTDGRILRLFELVAECVKAVALDSRSDAMSKLGELEAEIRKLTQDITPR